MKKIALIILIISSGWALATDVKPYPQANITIEQWENYHELVSKNLASSRRAYDSHKLEVFSEDQTQISFVLPSIG